MSLGSNIGAETAAEDILKFIEVLRKLPKFKEMTATEVASKIEAFARDMSETARSGWY
jgi:hypothetical protein